MLGRAETRGDSWDLSEGLASLDDLDAADERRECLRRRRTTRKRSSNCGRSSPSSGFIVPTRMKRDGFATPRLPHARRCSGPIARGIEEHVKRCDQSRRFTSVDVEDVAVRLGEHARLELLLAALDRRLDVDGTGRPVLGRI